MNLTELLFLLLGSGTIGGILFLSNRSNFLRSAALFLGVLLFVSSNSLPAFATPHLAALGSAEKALNPGQQQLEKNLKVTPEGAQYSGLEYVKESKASPLSDAQIRDRIENIEDDLVANVASGSVILSGTVEDKQTARKIVEKVKEIPGVHEITFELALEEIAS